MPMIALAVASAESRGRLRFRLRGLHRLPGGGIPSSASRSTPKRPTGKVVPSAGSLALLGAGRVGYKSRPHEEGLAQHASSSTPVVVMKPTENGDCVNAAARLERPWNRLLVPEGLVRTRFVVEADVLGD